MALYAAINGSIEQADGIRRGQLTSTPSAFRKRRKKILESIARLEKMLSHGFVEGYLGCVMIPEMVRLIEEDEYHPDPMTSRGKLVQSNLLLDLARHFRVFFRKPVPSNRDSAWCQFAAVVLTHVEGRPKERPVSPRRVADAWKPLEDKLEPPDAEQEPAADQTKTAA
jgi:hypothetical protein